jgi:hypothetical protein
MLNGFRSVTSELSKREIWRIMMSSSSWTDVLVSISIEEGHLGVCIYRRRMLMFIYTERRCVGIFEPVTTSALAVAGTLY